MVHTRFLEAYINFTLMYKAYHILPVLPIKDLTNEDGEPTMPYKLVTGMKLSILHLRVLFCPCVVQKSTAHVGTNALKMRHQAQNDFRGIFVGITQHQKGYLIYVPHKHKVVYLYDVFLNDILSSTLTYKSQPHSEAMAIRPDVSYISYDTYSRKKMAI